MHALISARDVRITRVVRETKDAVSLELEDVRGDEFVFRPGQFLTVLLSVKGESLRRAYSISSKAGANGRAKRVTITTKRVAGGIVSNYINDVLREGDVLQVLGPSGAFTVPPGDGTARHFVLLGGGSGITPLMSIARTVLETEPESRVSLVYGNRGVDDVIFRAELEELARTNAGRLTVRHVLADPPPDWAFGKGLLDRDVAAAELDALSVSSDVACEYFVCGPEAMMTEVRAALGVRGVPAANVREERFTQPHRRTKTSSEPNAGAATIRVNGQEIHLIVSPSQTLLEAGLEAGAPMPFSCAMGGCGACRVKVIDGSMVMEEPNCLSDEERASGYALACIGRPSGKVIVEV